MIIIVYICFLLIINLGFVLFGYALFSIKLWNFKNLGVGFLNVFLILSGHVKTKDVLDSEDASWSSVFITVFFFTNILLLLKFVITKRRLP